MDCAEKKIIRTPHLGCGEIRRPRGHHGVRSSPPSLGKCVSPPLFLPPGGARIGYFRRGGGRGVWGGGGEGPPEAGGMGRSPKDIEKANRAVYYDHLYEEL